MVFRVPELIHLNFSLKCLQMPVLEKKLTGGTLLIMKVIFVRNMANKNKTNASASNSALKWLTP